EAARDEDPGDTVEGRLLVPQHDRVGARDLEGVDRVDVPVRAREQDDADPDGHAREPAGASVSIDEAAPSTSMSYDSIRGFDNSSDASRSTIARAVTSSAALTVSSTRRPTRTAETPSIPRW